LIGEQDGLIPSPQWKRINQGENWSTGDTYIASVGQGYVLGTPLQILMSGATIANDGKLMQPTIVREVTDSEGKVVEMWFNPNDFSIWEPYQVTDDRSSSRAWVNVGDPEEIVDQLPEGSYQISPFVPNMKWNTTITPLIKGYSCEEGYCLETGETKVIQPSSIRAVQTGMRMAITNPRGTLNNIFSGFPIAVAGKTGTAEYCDDVALEANRCQFGQWPTHSWTLAYAPFDDPEIIIMAFAYNGGEGASVAGPMVFRVMESYFELKSIDIAQDEGG
jgi:penicillin-binding protein 2